MQREKCPATPVAGGGRRTCRFPARGGWRVVRLALWACALAAILPGAALPQAPVVSQGLPPGPAAAPTGDARQGERWLASYRACIERNVAGLAAHGGDVRQVAETAYGACRHMAAMAGATAERREALEQAAWSFALQETLRRMEGDGAYGQQP